MIQLRFLSCLLPNVLLVGLLIAGQFGAVLHAFEHEVGTPQNTVCATCIAAEQLSAGCIDEQAVSHIQVAPQRLAIFARRHVQSTNALVVRQRGPPTLY